MSVFRDTLFEGKVALITGGGSGIGLGIAEALARHGSDVAIVNRNQERLAAAADQFASKTSRRCLPLVADVRQPEAGEAAVNRAVQEFGGLDIVVNNAAGNFFCPSGQLSPNGFGTVIDIDAKGTWNVSRAAYFYCIWLGSRTMGARSSTSARPCTMAARPARSTSPRPRPPSTR